MITKHSPPPKPIRWNGHRRLAPVEALSARIFRLRIARGYSIYDLAREANVLAATIRQLESGKPADKRVLPALAAVLGMPLCKLVRRPQLLRTSPACARRHHRAAVDSKAFIEPPNGEIAR
jgi:transcriptional regulator with XRE-family HTH domain